MRARAGAESASPVARATSSTGPSKTGSAADRSGKWAHRETMVTGSRPGLLVTRMKRQFGGGSSRVLRKAFAALRCRRSASRMMPVFTAPGRKLVEKKGLQNSWNGSTRIRRDFDSGSSLCTSGWLGALSAVVSLTIPAISHARRLRPLPGVPVISMACGSRLALRAAAGVPESQREKSHGIVRAVFVGCGRRVPAPRGSHRE